MKPLAVIGFLALCGWVAVTYPVAAIITTGVFLTIGTVYERIRTQK